mmetsp:Transcript_39803/g.69944  ORF Transcript_39803/g.69944 Transcript_39803/m.69944 type:complete len:492 (+) Transcript_39803:37-1512(+)
MATTPPGSHQSPVAEKTRRKSLGEWYQSLNGDAAEHEVASSAYGPRTPIRRKKRTSLGSWWTDDAGLPDGRTPDTKEYFLDDDDAEQQVEGQVLHDMVATPCSARRGGFSPCFSNASSPRRVLSRLPSALTSPQCPSTVTMQAGATAESTDDDAAEAASAGASGSADAFAAAPEDASEAAEAEAEVTAAKAFSTTEYYAAHFRILPAEALAGLYAQFPQHRARPAVQQPLLQALVSICFDLWRLRAEMPAEALTETDRAAEQRAQVAEPSDRESVEAQRRVDPMLDGREVTWREYVSAYSAHELTPNQLLEHWLNLHPAQDRVGADAAEESGWAWGAAADEASGAEESSEAAGRFVEAMAAMARQTTANVLERMTALAVEASSIITGEDDEEEDASDGEVRQRPRERISPRLEAEEHDHRWAFGPSLSGTWEALCEIYEDTRDTVIETSRFVMSASEHYHQRLNAQSSTESGSPGSSSSETPTATVPSTPP